MRILHRERDWLGARIGWYGSVVWQGLVCKTEICAVQYWGHCHEKFKEKLIFSKIIVAVFTNPGPCDGIVAGSNSV